MLHESAEVNLEEPDLAIEAEEFIVFQFVIFRSEWLDFSIDDQIFTPLWHLEESANRLIGHHTLLD